ncbi:MAG: phosphatase PAP2 family protein [Acidimicrobiia bacterium]
MLASARRAVVRFDLAVDSAFDHLRGNKAADRVFYGASELGDFSLIWLLLAAARGLRSERDEKAAVRVAVGAAAESALVNGVIKSFFRRTRPPWDIVRPHRIRRPLTSSFPSGHATSAFSSAILLSEDDPLWPAYFAIAAVVASSRVYVKIHHASDVLAGVGVGVVLGVVGRKVMPLPPRGGGAGAPS